jgi:3-phenylpropionate/cinnamic acid dioxygenase small subunit
VRSDEAQIANLLYRYAELMDGGQLEAAAELFAHAEIVLDPAGPPVDSTALLAVWRTVLKLHDDGTPRTRHMVTNPQIFVDGDVASARSSYTVIQATDRISLQPIIVGRYHDEFERVDGSWRFSRRDYSLIDLVGDTSDHITITLRPSADRDQIDDEDQGVTG